MSSHITTHVLDAASGEPARELVVRLARHTANGLEQLAAGRTDPDGRIGSLGPEHLEPGTYRLTFGTGAYFAARSTPTLYPEIVIDVSLEAGRSHLHVPILLSPYSYTTYRGS